MGTHRIVLSTLLMNASKAARLNRSRNEFHTPLGAAVLKRFEPSTRWHVERKVLIIKIKEIHLRGHHVPHMFCNQF